MITILGKKLGNEFREKYGYEPRDIPINVKSAKEMLRALQSQFRGFNELVKEYPYYTIKRGSTLKNSKFVTPEEQDVQYYDEDWYIIPVPAGGVEWLVSVGFTVFWANVTVMVVMMAVSFGLNYLLAPDPNTSSFEEKKSSYLFDGPINTSKPGSTVPVAYGECFVGSVIVSALSELFVIDAQRTYSSKIKTVHVLSEGEIEGPAEGNWPQSTYFNETPVVTTNSGVNFRNSAVDGRVGTADQTYMTGFDEVGNEITVNTQVDWNSPIARTITDSEVDRAVVTLRWQSCFYSQSDGDIKPMLCTYRVTVTPDNGAGEEQPVTLVYDWDNFLEDDMSYELYMYYLQLKESTEAYTTDHVTIRKKTMKPFDIRVNIDNISQYGTAPWIVKTYRMQFDDRNQQYNSVFQWHKYSEIKDIKLSYPHTALAGVTLDARDFSGRLPESIFFKIKGRKVQVPDNYNPETRVYTGIWGGDFQTVYSNNPAWVLYDMITNKRFGLGNYIDVDEIDKYILYNIGEYCDEEVPVLYSNTTSSGSYTTTSGNEYRYTFNGAITNRDQAIQTIMDICSNMRAFPVWAASELTFVQESPKSSTRVANPSNVINGDFEYEGFGNDKRTNVINITYANMEDFGRAAPMTYIDEASVSLYGANPTEVVAVGCTSRSEALRKAKFIHYTNNNQKDVVGFKGGLEWADTYPGEIIDVQDPNYANVSLSGRIVSSTTTSITVDRDIEIEGGETYSLSIPANDTRAVHNRDLTNSVETTKVLTWSSALGEAPTAGLPFNLSSTSAAIRKFQVMSVKEVDRGVFELTGVHYRGSKYDEIEQGINVEAPLYADIGTAILPPSSIILQPYTREEGALGNIIQGVVISWEPSLDYRTLYYEVEDSSNYNAYNELGTVSDFSYDNKSATISGTYSARVRSVAATGKSVWTYSAAISISGDLETPPAPTDLNTYGQTGTFTGKDCTIVWTSVSGAYYNIDNSDGVYNYTLTQSGIYNIKNYKVETLTSSGVALRTYYTEGPLDNTYTYRYDFNVEDNVGTPTRNLKFRVSSVDLDNNTSGYTELDVSNPAPTMSAQTPVLTPKPGYIQVRWTPVDDADMDYYEVKYGTVSPTIDVGNVVHPAISTEVHGLEYGTTYYINVTPYDAFGVGVASQIASGGTLLISGTDVDMELQNSVFITDSDGNPSETTATLYDGIWDTGGITYTVSGTSSGTDTWIQYEYGIQDYIDRIAIWPNNANAQVYISTSTDGSTWSYFKAEADHTTDADGRLLTASGIDDARTNYWQITDGDGVNVAMLPDNVIASYVRVHMTGSYTTTIHELVPARMLIAEMAAIGSLSVISVNAGTITAGSLQSSDYSPTEGMIVDLDNKDIEIRKGGDDKFIYDGDTGNLTIAGQVTLLPSSEVPWSTVTGSGTPDDNADVTGDNTSGDTLTVSGVASSIIAGWRETGKTTINGGVIETDSINVGTLTANSVVTTNIQADNITKIHTDTYETTVYAQSGLTNELENTILESGVMGGSNYERTVHVHIDLHPTGFGAGDYVHYQLELFPGLALCHSELQWNTSSGTSGEFFVSAIGGGDPGFSNEEPDFYLMGDVYETGTETVGSLTSSGIGWGKHANDNLTYDTVYARIPGDTSPGLQGDDYINAFYINSTTGLPSMFWFFSDYFRASTAVSATHRGFLSCMYTFNTSPFPMNVKIGFSYTAYDIGSSLFHKSDFGHLTIWERYR